LRARIPQCVTRALMLCGNEVEAQRGQRRAFAGRRNDSTAQSRRARRERESETAFEIQPLAPTRRVARRGRQK